jgi:hypothetical protein
MASAMGGGEGEEGGKRRLDALTNQLDAVCDSCILEKTVAWMTEVGGDTLPAQSKPFFEMYISSLAQQLDMVCGKNANDEYCFPKFGQFMAGMNDGTVLTEGFLDNNVCAGGDTCVLDVFGLYGDYMKDLMEQMAAMGMEDMDMPDMSSFWDKMTGFICLKNGDKYCVAGMMAHSSGPTDTGGCGSCEGAPSITDRANCGTCSNGAYTEDGDCYENGDLWTEGNWIVDNDISDNQACKDNLKLYEPLGCCIDSISDLMSAMPVESGGVAKGTYEKMFKAAGIELTGVCSVDAKQMDVEFEMSTSVAECNTLKPALEKDVKLKKGATQIKDKITCEAAPASRKRRALNDGSIATFTLVAGDKALLNTAANVIVNPLLTNVKVAAAAAGITTPVVSATAKAVVTNPDCMGVPVVNKLNGNNDITCKMPSKSAAASIKAANKAAVAVVVAAAGAISAMSMDV